MLPARDRVPRACQRCRRQKLKCDAEKPCMLCSRARIECIVEVDDVWRPVQKKREPVWTRSQSLATRPNVSSKTSISHFEGRGSETNDEDVQNWASAAKRRRIGSKRLAPAIQDSSSVEAIVEEAFSYHRPECHPDLSALRHRDGKNAQSNVSPRALSGQHMEEPLWRPPFRSRRGLNAASAERSRNLVKEFIRLLPSKEPATLLIDTYFDRVHWFMLLFHQDDFRARFCELLGARNDPALLMSLGFLSTTIAVFIISVQYLGHYRTEKLQNLGIDGPVLQAKMLEALGRGLLDVIALGSIESIHTCVLLSTYYLYHGEPDLAWSICGCGLRIAQALNLHRKVERFSSTPQPLGAPSRLAEETRKRCWWAIYEVETFCSMLYGLPLSISDHDCDVELLNPKMVTDGTTCGKLSDAPTSSTTTLLSYKPMMSRLSVVIITALTDLYKVSHTVHRAQDSPTQATTPIENLISKVQDLERKLLDWHEQLPPELRLQNYRASDSFSYSDAELERAIGATGAKFDALLFHLQALILAFAFQNARILIHRPLLAHRKLQSTVNRYLPSETGQASVEACRDAAIQISLLGASPIFPRACNTYAVAFLGTHLFTAGVTLCIMAGLNPMSTKSHKAKLRLRRILRSRAGIESQRGSTDQGLKILKKLTALVMEKELNLMLESSVALESTQLGLSSDEPISQAPFDRFEAPESLSEDAAESGRDTANKDQPELRSPGQGHAESREEKVADHTRTYDHFFEDQSTLNLVLSLDQGMTLSTSQQSDGTLTAPAQSIDQLDAFIEQEQGWIWGFDFLQPSLEP